MYKPTDTNLPKNSLTRAADLLFANTISVEDLGGQYRITGPQTKIDAMSRMATLKVDAELLQDITTEELPASGLGISLPKHSLSIGKEALQQLMDADLATAERLEPLLNKLNQEPPSHER